MTVKVSVVTGMLMDELPEPVKFPFVPVKVEDDVLVVEAVTGEPSVEDVETEEEGAVPVPGRLDELTELYPTGGP